MATGRVEDGHLLLLVFEFHLRLGGSRHENQLQVAMLRFPRSGCFADPPGNQEGQQGFAR
jgi:hypothetical protein